MKEKILTISVAAYNVEKYITELLDSIVLAKSRDKIEVFVIDDGGSDGTLRIAKEYEINYPGIVYAVHKENGGWGSTVNYGITHANGKYFRLLDGDDYFDTDSLDIFVQYISEIESDLIISSFMSFDDVSRVKIYEKKVDQSYQNGLEYSIDHLDKDILLSMASFTVKTSLLKENVRCKEKCLYRDMEFTSKTISACKTVSFFQDIVYCYRLGRQGQSVEKASYLRHKEEHADIVYCVLDTADKNKGETEKQHIIYELAKGAVSQHYRIYSFDLPSNEMYKELIKFDNKLKRDYPLFYENYKPPKSIERLKSLKAHKYVIACFYNYLAPKIAKLKNQILSPIKR